MNVLAVVSKALFEKEARVGAKLVGVGDVWPTARYASQNPGLEPLASGGALFLVTVRPGDVLWLVGVLEAPKKSKEGWSAAENTIAVRDVTPLLPKLRFSTGKGINAEPGKLGMSLQTPRQLTDDDEALLRGGATARVVTPAPAPAWRLDSYRMRALSTKLTAKESTLLEPFQGLLEQNDEDAIGIELADVVDTASGKVLALYARWPVYAGALIDVASGEVLADVVDGYFDAHRDDALRERVRAAEEEAAPRLRFAERVDYRGGGDTPKQAATPEATPSDPATLTEMRALHAELDRTKGMGPEARDTKQRIDPFWPKVFRQEIRPYPMRRFFELDQAQRVLLELTVDHDDFGLELWWHGLPRKTPRAIEPRPGVEDPLARFVGRTPPLPLDTTVELEGKPHPLWAIVSDVLVGLRPDAAFFSALDAQPPEVRAGVWRQLAFGHDHLDILHPRDKKEAQRGWADPKAQDAHKAKYATLLREVFARLGQDAERVARAALDEPLPKERFERRGCDRLRLAALDGLAQLAAKAGGVLDPAYDPVLEEIVIGDRAPNEQLVALFRDLPAERARELTGLNYILLPLFPSLSGLRRILDRMATDERWQHPTGMWPKIAAQLAGKQGAAALPLLEETKPKLTRYRDGLDKAIAAAEKAAAKKSVKRK